MLSWDDHHLVLTLARGGTLAAAARRLGVNETTVARRLTAIEVAAGTTLFRRVDRRLEPSVSGKAIVATAEAMERALAEAAGDGQPLAGIVRVSAISSVIEHLIAPHLADFVARHPDLVLELVGANETVSLARREADIAIRLEQPGRGKLVARKVGRLRFRLAAARGAGCGEDMPAGYLAYDRELDDMPEMRALRSRFSGPPLARIDSLAGMRAAAEAGVGAAMLPDWMIAASPRLAVLDPSVRAERPLWLVAHADLKDRPAVRAAMNWLAATIAAAPAMHLPEMIDVDAGVDGAAGGG